MKQQGLLQKKIKPNRSPAQRVRFGKEEQRNECAPAEKPEQTIWSLLRRGTPEAAASWNVPAARSIAQGSLPKSQRFLAGGLPMNSKKQEYGRITILLFPGTPEGTRTPNIQNRNLTLYPIELRTHTPRFTTLMYYSNYFPKCKEEISQCPKLFCGHSMLAAHFQLSAISGFCHNALYRILRSYKDTLHVKERQNDTRRSPRRTRSYQPV